MGAPRRASACINPSHFQVLSHAAVPFLTPCRRYGRITAPLRQTFSEFGLIRFRVLVECRWLQKLSQIPGVVEVPPFSPEANQVLDKLAAGFTVEQALAVRMASAASFSFSCASVRTLSALAMNDAVGHCILYSCKLPSKWMSTHQRHHTVLRPPDQACSDLYMLLRPVQVKEVEKTTNHDVKAIEYVLKDHFKLNPELNKVPTFSLYLTRRMGWGA